MSCVCAKSLYELAMKMPAEPDWEALLRKLPFPIPSASFGAPALDPHGATEASVQKMLADPPQTPKLATEKVHALAKWAHLWATVKAGFGLDLTQTADQQALAQAMDSLALNSAALAPLRALDLSALNQVAAWAQAVADLAKRLKLDLRHLRTDAELMIAVRQAQKSPAAKAQQAALAVEPSRLSQITLICQLYAESQFAAATFNLDLSRPGAAARLTEKIHRMMQAPAARRAVGGLPILELSKLAAILAAVKEIMAALEVNILLPEGPSQLAAKLALYPALQPQPILAVMAPPGGGSPIHLPNPKSLELAHKMGVAELDRIGQVTTEIATPMYDVAPLAAAVISQAKELNLTSSPLVRNRATACGSACPIMAL